MQKKQRLISSLITVNFHKHLETTLVFDHQINDHLDFKMSVSVFYYKKDTFLDSPKSDLRLFQTPSWWWLEVYSAEHPQCELWSLCLPHKRILLSEPAFLQKKDAAYYVLIKRLVKKLKTKTKKYMTFDMEVVKVMFTPFIADTECPCLVWSFISKG